MATSYTLIPSIRRSMLFFFLTIKKQRLFSPLFYVHCCREAARATARQTLDGGDMSVSKVSPRWHDVMFFLPVNRCIFTRNRNLPGRRDRPKIYQ
jgi:hypothetical protein